MFGEYRAPTGVGAVAAPVGDLASGPRPSAGCATKALGGQLRLLVGKPGLDGHSNGAEQIAVAARDAGFEVDLPGHPAHSRADRGRGPRRGRRRGGTVDPLGLAPRARARDGAALRDAGVDAPVVVGGIIPDDDKVVLEAAGVDRVYTPKDYQLARIISDIADLAIERRERLAPAGR